MALRVNPKSEVNIVQLCTKITHCAIQVGGHLRTFELLQRSLNPADYGKRLRTFEDIGEEKILNAVEAMLKLVDVQAHFDALEEAVNATDGVAFALLNSQMNLLRYTSDCANASAEGFTNDLYERIDDLYGAVMQRLSVYRDKRSEQSWTELRRASDRLQSAVSLAWGSNVNRWKIRAMNTWEWVNLSNHSHELHDLVALDMPNTNLLRQLDFSLTGQAPTPEFMQGLKQTISSYLSSESRTLLDSFIYLGSKDPQKKMAADWAEEHRYDDMQNFRDAFAAMMRTEYGITLAITYTEAANTLFNWTLHKLAHGPEEEHFNDWAEKELPYLVPLFNKVHDRLRQEVGREGPSIPSPKMPQEVSSGASQDSQSGSSLRSLSSEELDDDHTEEDLNESASIDKLDLQDLEKKKPFEQLESLKRKIEERVSASGGVLSTDLSHQLKSIIKMSLSMDMAQLVYQCVEEIAADVDPTHPKWGELHCADDIVRLRQAIENAKTKLL